MQLLATIFTLCFILLYNMLYCFPQYISLFILFPSMFYSFSSMSPCFLTCFIAMMMLAQLSWVMICLNTLFVLRSTCLGAFYHVCAQIFMSMCFFPFPCAPQHVYAQIYIFMCSLPCLCLDLHVGCHALCFSSLFVSCYAFFLSFDPQVGCRSRSCGLGPNPYTLAYIKGFGSFLLCMCMLVCFYALCLCLFGQIQVLAMLCTLRGLVLVVLWGHLLYDCILPFCGLL